MAEDHTHCVTGKFEQPTSASSLIEYALDGVACVVAPCQGSANPRYAVVVCTDIFGMNLPNVQSLAQELAAAAGVEVYIPDLCLGEPCSPKDFDMAQLPAWFSRHGDAQTLPVLKKVLRALRAGGKERIMTLGFCWGARYAVLAAHGPHPLVDAWAVAHPTKTSPPDYAAAAPVPGLFLLAETDGMFPATAVAETRELLEGKGTYVFEGPYKGTSHGFVVRGDDSIPEVAEGRAAARAATAAFAKSQMASWQREGPKPQSAYGAGCDDSSEGGGGHSHGGHSHSGGGHSHVRLCSTSDSQKQTNKHISHAHSNTRPHTHTHTLNSQKYTGRREL
jgi:dienelactone hydrolase